MQPIKTLPASLLCSLITALTFFLVLPLPGSAQISPLSAPPVSEPEATLPSPLTPEAINELVARMPDDQVRALLLDTLEAAAATEAELSRGTSLVEKAERFWEAFTAPITKAVGKLPVLVSRQADAIGTFADRYGGSSGVARLFGLIFMVLAIGYAAELLFKWATRRFHHLENGNSEADLKSAVAFLFRRFCGEIMGLIVFYIVIRAVGRALLTPADLQFAAPVFTYLIWMPRLTSAAARFIMAPNRADLRLVNVSDHWAKFIHRNVVGLIFLSGLTIFSVVFNRQNGVMMGETYLGFWLDSAVYVYLIIIAWTAREGLTDMMRSTDPDRTEFDEKVARSYPYLAIGVSAGMWIIVTTLSGLGRLTQVLQGAHYSTMFWLLMAPLFDTAIRGLVRHLVPAMIGEGKVAEEAFRSTKRSYIRIGRVLVAGLIILIISGAWDVNLRTLTSDVVGFADNIIGFLMTIVVGYVVYEVVSLWINRRLAMEQTSSGATEEEIGGDGGGAGGSRLATVLPLLLVSAQIAIMVIFGLLAVGALGIDITPLLAGAGILGLAIGFGAQKLVTDVVSGIFFLVDDAFRVGEYVEVDGTMGTVEKISIRSMQLRHHRGLVHTIPYGEIPKLTNYSRDWVIMKLRFTVPFDTDPNKVKKIFKKIGASMLEDPLFKDDFLQPFKSQGVFDFDDVGMIIRGKFMAKPGTQFTLRKEIYNRVKAAFAENDIDFARREVRVAIPGLDDQTLSEQEKSALGAAAAGAVQQAVQEQDAAAAGGGGAKDDR